MEIHPPSQTTGLPSAQQAQAAVSATADAGATETLQKTPDNVVTAVTNPDPANARDDDAMRREEARERNSIIETFKNLKIDGLKTRLGYDSDNERIYLEILISHSDEVLQRIPSELLLSFLEQQVAKSLSSLNSNRSPINRAV